MDIDGTVLRSAAPHRIILQSLLMDAGLIEQELDFSTFSDRTDTGILRASFERRHGRTPTRSEQASFEQAMAARYAALGSVDSQVMPGVLDLLARLQTKPNWNFAFATGCWRESATKKLSILGLARPCMSTASEFQSRPDILSQAIALGWRDTPPAARGLTVFVGDGVWDAQAAGTVAIPFIGIAEGSAATELMCLGAHAVVPDFTNFWPILEDLSARLAARAARQPKLCSPI
ncbi:hypothetical protein AT984_20825 [Paucibacter sp. KCTC 42545]|nr:hypothetical protein AT984_20825 [Paucibacter sp. KCTC 42545]